MHLFGQVSPRGVTTDTINLTDHGTLAQSIRKPTYACLGKDGENAIVERLYLVAAFAIIAAVVVIVVAVRAKLRTDGWRQVAADLGLSFPGRDNDLLERFGHLRMLSRGHSRRMTNVLAGDAREVEINVGDYTYTTGRGKTSQAHRQTVCILQSRELNVPHCFLRPNSPQFDFLGELFSGRNIGFDDDPKFSHAYVLQGESENAIREIFDPAVRAWFVQRRGDNLHFEAFDHALMFHSARQVLPEQTRGVMQQALEICNLLGQRQGAAAGA